MDSSTQIRLTEFAASLVSRSRAQVATDDRNRETFPHGQSTEALRAALAAQGEQMETLRASFSAEIDALLVTVDRMDVEVALLRGELARVTADHAAQSIELYRVRVDMRELADQMVARLVDQFDQRAKSLR